MSEFHIRVVRLGPIEKHPNADTLSITQIDGGYPVIFRTGEYKEGDLAAYVPVDAIVPDFPEWRFLAPNILPGEPVPEKYRRIRARRLRGIFSMGLITKATPNSKEGNNVQEVLGITKYEPPTEAFGTGLGVISAKLKWFNSIPWYKKPLTRYFWIRLWYRTILKKGISHNLPDPDFFPKYTDIEGLRKYGNVLVEGEEVVINEKIHGCSARFGWHKGKFWVGSHNHFKRKPGRGEPTDWWWTATATHNLEERLKGAPGIGFYGEVYGDWVQDLHYGSQNHTLGVTFFDAMDLKTGKYLDYDNFINLCISLNLQTVPELYRGPWHKELRALAEGKTTLNADHTREGFVVRPVKERFERSVGRCILKYVGEGYLLRKGG